MIKKILYILSSYNNFSGTPKKTLDLIKYSEHNSFLYVYSNAYHEEFKEDLTRFSHLIKSTFLMITLIIQLKSKLS